MVVIVFYEIAMKKRVFQQDSILRAHVGNCRMVLQNTVRIFHFPSRVYGNLQWHFCSTANRRYPVYDARWRHSA
ncbi:hypothetical protein [Paraburkholderia flava]|uniref:hypothetical protein n=1 Tax=Paraburkholderia flava TaxID=2547393 RepID=UPI00105C9738|nr:hypothetical protein [Paraburkholderia flava]